MDKDVLSRENHAFFVIDLAPALMNEQFEHAVSRAAEQFEWLSQSDDNEEELVIERRECFGSFSFPCCNGELGYLQIGMQSAHNLQNGVRPNSFWKHRIPRSIGGTFNDQCTIQEGEWRIRIRIIGYESTLGVFSDPTKTDIPDDEPLGRVVAVFIIPYKGDAPEDELFDVDELLCVWNEQLPVSPV